MMDHPTNYGHSYGGTWVPCYGCGGSKPYIGTLYLGKPVPAYICPICDRAEVHRGR